MADKVLATNRQARYNYTILQSMEAGIALKGTEVKSLRAGKASFNDSFARAEGNEMLLFNMHIAPYEFGNIANVEPLRPRKLLLHRSQIKKLAEEAALKHLAIIPLKIYLKNGFVKVEIALAKGKKFHDKRESIKKRESDREIRRRIAQ